MDDLLLIVMATLCVFLAGFLLGYLLGRSGEEA
jgi:hypothetical protein